MGPAVLITHQPWELVQLVWQTLKTTDSAPKTTAARFKTRKNILPGQLKSIFYLYIFLTIYQENSITNECYSVLVLFLHQYCLNNGRTADGSSEFTYSGSSGSSVEREKKPAFHIPLLKHIQNFPHRFLSPVSWGPC